MDFYTSFHLALLIFCLTMPVILLSTKRSMTKNKLPPGPKGFPIIGNLLTVGDKPHESLAMLAKIYGPLMTVRLGCVTTVVASSTEMAREILQTNGQVFLGRPIPDAVTAEIDYQLSIAWLPGGQQWRKLRKIFNTHIFTAQRLDLLQESRQKTVENMIRSVDVEADVYIGRLVFGTTLNLLSNTMFSFDVLDLKSTTDVQELKELIWKIMELAGKPNLADFFPFLKPFDPQGIKRSIKVSYDRLHELVENIIDQRMKRTSESARTGDFLDALLDHSEEGGTEELERREIGLMLMDLFIGGTDTTTTTMEWIMAELLHNPAKMGKAKQELAEKFGSGVVSIQEQEVMQLPYLNAIIKETMRLHPVAPLLLPHRAEKEVEICGFTIPKHTQVLVNAWSISRDSAYWENPTKFEPERFLSSEFDFRGNQLSFIPFGAGRRICPGVSLGVRMVNLLLATLLHNFDWKLPNGMAAQDMDMKDKFGVTLQKADPLVAIAVKATV